jgi:hypothetical protein
MTQSRANPSLAFWQFWQGNEAFNHDYRTMFPFLHLMVFKSFPLHCCATMNKGRRLADWDSVQGLLIAFFGNSEPEAPAGN